MISSRLRYRCAHCHQLFTEKEAKCDNWQDPTQSFICPHCDINLLRVDRAQRSPWRQLLMPTKLWMGVLVFALALWFLSRRGGLPPLFPYVATGFAIIGVWVAQWFKEPPPEQTETVDLVMEKNNRNNVYQFRAKHDES